MCFDFLLASLVRESAGKLLRLAHSPKTAVPGTHNNCFYGRPPAQALGFESDQKFYCLNQVAFSFYKDLNYLRFCSELSNWFFLSSFLLPATISEAPAALLFSWLCGCISSPGIVPNPIHEEPRHTPTNLVTAAARWQPRKSQRTGLVIASLYQGRIVK